MRFKNYLKEMAYPVTFDIEHFKSLRSFAARKKYANEKLLGKLGQGSSRAVFNIDNEKVLKVAINPKGIAQNEAELGVFDHYSERIVAKIFDADYDTNMWIEAEYAKKPTKKEFENLTGVSITKLQLYLFDMSMEYKIRKTYSSLDPDEKEEMDNNEFVIHLVDLIHNYGLPFPGDFGTLTSYGIANRDGQKVMVVSDYGFSKDVQDLYFKKRR